MSLFLPSNLSPNFEEIVPNVYNEEKSAYDGVNISFQFQVNTNGSCVRSYKLEILNDKNDAEIPEDNILATFYGTFETPLYNKDVYTITILQNELEEQMQFEISKDYRWRIRLYEDEIYDAENNINIQTIYGNTYVGEGRTVGTTKNVIWLNTFNEDIVEEKFIQTVLYSDEETNDFNPFYEKLIRNKEDKNGWENQYQKGIRIDTKDTYEDFSILNGFQIKSNSSGDQIITGIVVDINEILSEYRKKITDGNMYLQLLYEYGDESYVPTYDTNQLPKLITGVRNLATDGYEPQYIIEIDERQGYIYHQNAQLNFKDNRYSLVYIQRQQIYSVDKSIGTHQLTKITLDEPLDYNTFHNTNIETGLMSDDFDRGRVYINPVKEFDSKLVPSAYINIAYTKDQLLYTNTNDITNDDLSNYTNSLACVQLTNYVAKTGECSLFSDLNFKPDRHYMYQVFVVNQKSSEYNPANSTNPYKFYAGTTYNSEDDTINPYYLGGYNGDLTNNDDQTNLLRIYSNHQIGSTNQFLCFIQPNLGIYEDQYKPCMLQLYNNTCHKDVYITNYNGNNTYNKDYSIDTLDDSQWLVVLTYSSGNIENDVINELRQLIQKPQTKYKIYTNFVNNIPEAYFYYRSNKILEFNYFNFYSNSLLEIEREQDLNGYQLAIIPQRDIIVRCNIYDADDITKQKNLATIKYYKYIIAEVDMVNISQVKKIVYESDNLYDSKYEYVIKGLNKDQRYRIQITAEDEYGYIYQFAEDVCFDYSQEIVNDRISAQIDCDRQAVHVDFAPIKTFYGVGDIVGDLEASIVSVVGSSGLLFNSLQDIAYNEISIPENFTFYSKLKINDGIFDNENEQSVLVIEDDAQNSYKVTFDTRVYVPGADDKLVINADYLSLRCYKNKDLIDTKPITELYNNLFKKPSGFEYAFSKQSENQSRVYFIESTTANQKTKTINTNLDTNLLQNGYYQVPNGTDYKIYAYNAKDINKSNKSKMGLLYFKITTNQDNSTFTVSTTNIK